jgi:hypothetical protein
MGGGCVRVVGKSTATNASATTHSAGARITLVSHLFDTQTDFVSRVCAFEVGCLELMDGAVGDGDGDGEHAKRRRLGSGEKKGRRFGLEV